MLTLYWTGFTPVVRICPAAHLPKTCEEVVHALVEAAGAVVVGLDQDVGAVHVSAVHLLARAHDVPAAAVCGFWVCCCRGWMIVIVPRRLAGFEAFFVRYRFFLLLFFVVGVGAGAGAGDVAGSTW